MSSDDLAAATASSRSKECGAEGWRLGLAMALGALLTPAALVGGAAAVLLAVGVPPYNALTGLGRWDVHLAFSAMGAILSLWLLAGPATCMALAALRRLLRLGHGPRRPAKALLAALLAPALTAVALSFGLAWQSAAGIGTPGFENDFRNMMQLFLPACLGASLWFALWRALAPRAFVAFARALHLEVGGRDL